MDFTAMRKVIGQNNMDKAIIAHSIAKRLWIKACAFDGIPADSMFVCFSDSNPYAAARDRAMNLYFDFLKRKQPEYITV